MMNTTKGGQDIIELIYNFASPKDYAYKYRFSHGFYGGIKDFLLVIDLEQELQHQTI